ncbi:MAG: hypothetical protein N3D09_02915 [Archaeoglobaceae archaeon]|nr:hypothetical protein [Archaeoglobaceae archaeon]
MKVSSIVSNTNKFRLLEILLKDGTEGGRALKSLEDVGGKRK